MVVVITSRTFHWNSPSIPAKRKNILVSRDINRYRQGNICCSADCGGIKTSEKIKHS